MLLTSRKLLEEGFLPPKPKSMNDIIEKFAEDNDSAAAFILDVGLDKVVGYFSRSRQRDVSQLV